MTSVARLVGQHCHCHKQLAIVTNQYDCDYNLLGGHCGLEGIVCQLSKNSPIAPPHGNSATQKRHGTCQSRRYRGVLINDVVSKNAQILD